MIVSRWKCSECGEVCEKKPVFKIGPDSPRRTVEYTYKDMFNNTEYTIKQVVVEGVCNRCKHSSRSHSFTFEKPEKKDKVEQVS